MCVINYGLSAAFNLKNKNKKNNWNNPFSEY